MLIENGPLGDSSTPRARPEVKSEPGRPQSERSGAGQLVFIGQLRLAVRCSIVRMLAPSPVSGQKLAPGGLEVVGPFRCNSRPHPAPIDRRAPFVLPWASWLRTSPVRVDLSPTTPSCSPR